MFPYTGTYNYIKSIYCGFLEYLILLNRIHTLLQDDGTNRTEKYNSFF